MTAPPLALLRRQAAALVLGGFVVAALAAAVALTAGPGRTLPGRLPDALFLTALLAVPLALGHLAGRFRHHPALQGVGALFLLAAPVALILSLIAGVGTLAFCALLAALATWGLEARKPWAPNALLALPLVPAGLHALLSATEGGTFAEGVEAALLGTAALVAHELARHGDAFREALRDVRAEGEADAPTRRALAQAAGLGGQEAVILGLGLGFAAVLFLLLKEQSFGRSGLGDALGSPSLVIPVLLTLLALALVGFLLLQQATRGDDEGAG
ncbi:MAG TPA: hypothetical protein VNZ52_16780 [Candidatus Thermoplasmatota archaeon]|nr:hypothetical protein [Candidatus Thermoplasmatota archaeon]